MFIIRKILILVLFILLLGALFFYGSAYFYGSELRKQIETRVSLYNQFSQDLTVSLEQYEQGILGSNAKVLIAYRDLTPVVLKLKMIHQPVIYNDYINDVRRGFHYFKLLVQIDVMTEFLSRKTDFFQHVALIDPKKSINLALNLDKMSYVFYRLIGFHSNNIKYLDAKANIELNNDDMVIEIMGQGVDLLSENNSYFAEKSDFSMVYQLYPKQKAINSSNQLATDWRNKFNLKINAYNLATNPDTGYEAVFVNPKLDLNYDGEIGHFISMLQGNNSIIDLLEAKQNYDLITKLSNTSFDMTNLYKDKLKANDFSLEFAIQSKEESKAIDSSLKLGDINFKSITDSFSTQDIELLFNIEAPNRFAVQLLSTIQRELNLNQDEGLVRNNSILRGMIYDNNIDSFNIAFKSNNLKGKGLVIGKCNLDKLVLNFDLNSDQVTNQHDKILHTNALTENFTWQMKDTMFQVDIDDLNFKLDGVLNLSQYIDTIIRKNNQPYYTKYKLELNSPKFKLVLPWLDFKMSGMQVQSDFELNQKTTGYLTNMLNIGSFNLATDKFKLDIENIESKSNMQQVYKFILAGFNSVHTKNTKLDVNQHQIALDKFKYDSKSKLDKENLEYINDFDLNSISIDANDLGNISLNNKFTDIQLKDYEELMLKLNAISMNQSTNEEVARSEIDTNITKTILNFLDQGLTVNNALSLSSKNSNKKEDAVKITNILKFKDINVDNSLYTEASSGLLSTLFKKSNFIVKVDLSKSYIEDQLKKLKLDELNSLYKNMRAIGVLDFVGDTAELKVLYKHPNVMINGQSFDYWQQQIKARNNRDNYFEKLKE